MTFLNNSKYWDVFCILVVSESGTQQKQIEQYNEYANLGTDVSRLYLHVFVISSSRLISARATYGPFWWGFGAQARGAVHGGWGHHPGQLEKAHKSVRRTGHQLLYLLAMVIATMDGPAGYRFNCIIGFIWELAPAAIRSKLIMLFPGYSPINKFKLEVSWNLKHF